MSAFGLEGLWPFYASLWCRCLRLSRAKSSRGMFKKVFRGLCRMRPGSSARCFLLGTVRKQSVPKP